MSDGRRKIDLILPTRPVALTARSAVTWLRTREGGAMPDADLGRVELQPVKGKVTRGELEVQDPFERR